MDKPQERGQKILSPWKLESRPLPRQAERRGFSGSTVSGGRVRYGQGGCGAGQAEVAAGHQVGRKGR
jgi:hypothetical protein